MAHGPTNQERNARPHIRNVTTVENLGISQKYADNPGYQNHDKTAKKHIDIKEQAADYTQSEYTTPYVTNEQAKAAIKCLKTTAKIHHIQDKDTKHIRPIWVAQSQGSQILQTDCEVDTGAGCNILPAHKAQQLFGQE